MAYEPKPGDGSLFANKKREKETHPNATGYIIAHRDIKAGERLRLAAWTKEGTNGKFQSLKLSDDQAKTESKPQQTAPADDDFSDPIPF